MLWALEFGGFVVLDELAAVFVDLLVGGQGAAKYYNLNRTTLRTGDQYLLTTQEVFTTPNPKLNRLQLLKML